MKKQRYASIAFLVLCLSLLLSSSALCEGPGDAGEEPDVPAKAAAVLNLDDGNLIYEKAVDERMDPGDLTKVMTALILMENCDLEETVSFSEILYVLGEGSTRLGLQPGEEITLYDAACALLLGSADDVANGIAEYVAGSTDAFAERMNERAQELGCVNTHFSNPNGAYSGDHYTCAYDLALIAKAAYENESFRWICGLTEYTIPATNLTDETRRLQNTHQMLWGDSDYYREWCVGGEESSASQSAEAVMTFANRGGTKLVSVVMGAEDAGAAYRGTDQLIDYGFANSSLDRTRMTEASTEAAQTETESATEAVTETVQQAGSAAQERQTDGETGQTADEAVSQEAAQVSIAELLAGYWKEGERLFSEYAKDHFKEVFIGGCIFMAVLFLLIVVLIHRRITNAKIRKKRKKAEKLMREKEALIEQITVEEMEAELRRRHRQDGGEEKEGN